MAIVAAALVVGAGAGLGAVADLPVRPRGPRPWRAAAGQPWGDPVAGLAITASICHVGNEVTADVEHRLAAGVDPQVIHAAEAGAGSMPGVVHAHARARWTGRTLRNEIEGGLLRISLPAAPTRSGSASRARSPRGCRRREASPGPPGPPHSEKLRVPAPFSRASSRDRCGERCRQVQVPRHVLRHQAGRRRASQAGGAGRHGKAASGDQPDLTAGRRAEGLRKRPRGPPSRQDRPHRSLICRADLPATVVGRPGADHRQNHLARPDRRGDPGGRRNDQAPINDRACAGPTTRS